MSKRHTRRGYGEGNIQEYQARDGSMRYMIRWTEPEQPGEEDSLNKRRSLRGFTDKHQARTRLLGILAAVNEGRQTPKTSGAPTLGDYLDEWIAGHRVAASTKAGYRKNIRLHVKPYVGHLPLSKVKPATLAGLYRTLEETGNKQAGAQQRPVGLGPNTIRKVHQMLSTALADACEDYPQFLPVNPAKSKAAKPPSSGEVTSARKETTIWTVDELYAFLDWARREVPDFAPLWHFTAHTGLRRAELAGLRWKDIDLTEQAVQVRRTRTPVRNKGEAGYEDEKPPKSYRARTVFLDSSTTAVMRQWRKDQAARGFWRIQPSSPVFTMPGGEAIRPDYFTYQWGRTRDRYHSSEAGLMAPRVTLHELRHTHASHLLAAGIHPKIVQERLGHSTIAITMDLYSHVMKSAQMAAMEEFDAAIAGRSNATADTREAPEQP